MPLPIQPAPAMGEWEVMWAQAAGGLHFAKFSGDLERLFQKLPYTAKHKPTT